MPTLGLFGPSRPCSKCPFGAADGSPCERERFEVSARFNSPQYFHTFKIFERGEKINGMAVVVEGKVYCIKAPSKVIRGQLFEVDLFALLYTSIVLVPQKSKKQSGIARKRSM